MSSEFDEDYYLRSNPDIATAVAQRVYASGLEHYQRYGRDEGRLPAAAPNKNYLLYIDVFSYCNLRCPSCLVGSKFGDTGDWRRGLMSAETLGRILDKAISECRNLQVGLYNWTEPLLHPEIARLCRTVKEKGLYCSLSTNLNVLREPEQLLASGLDWLRVSVSGFTQETYRIGHRGGDIEAVKRNLHRLAESRRKVESPTVLEIFYHVYNDNEDEVAPMAALAAELGFEFATIPAYLTTVEKVLEAAAGKQNAEDAALLSRLAVPLDRALAITAQLGLKTCALLEDTITIDVAGNAMLCCGCSMAPSNVIGSYLDLPLSEIQSRRRRHELCGPCLQLGVPSYFLGHPEFDNIATEAKAARTASDEPDRDAAGEREVAAQIG